jgi:hypothetical protein
MMVLIRSRICMIVKSKTNSDSSLRVPAGFREDAVVVVQTCMIVPTRSRSIGRVILLLQCTISPYAKNMVLQCIYKKIHVYTPSYLNKVEQKKLGREGV